MYDENSPKQTPKSVYITIIVLLVLCLVALSGWYFYKTRQLDKQLSESASKIVSLEAEKVKLEADKKLVEESATANKDGYQISELKISFNPSSGLTGLVYAYDQKNKVAAFTTRDIGYKFSDSVEVSDPYNLRAGVLGLVYILEDTGVKDGVCKVTIKKIGNRTVCYTPPQQIGTDNAKVRDEAEKAGVTLQADLKSTVQSTN